VLFSGVAGSAAADPLLDEGSELEVASDELLGVLGCFDELEGLVEVASEEPLGVLGCLDESLPLLFELASEEPLGVVGALAEELPLLLVGDLSGFAADVIFFFFFGLDSVGITKSLEEVDGEPLSASRRGVEAGTADEEPAELTFFGFGLSADFSELETDVDETDAGEVVVVDPSVSVSIETEASSAAAFLFLN